MTRKRPKKNSQKSKNRRLPRISFTWTGERLTTAQISKIEFLLSPFKFPEDYRKYLLQHNGGYPSPAHFNWCHPTGERCSHVDHLLGVVPGRLDEVRPADIVSVTLGYRYDLPRHSVPIGFADRDDILMIFVGGPREGQIWIKAPGDIELNFERPADSEAAIYFVASSFADFLGALHELQDSYDPVTFALDSPRVRGRQLEATLKPLGCKKFKYPGLMFAKPVPPPAWQWPKYCRSQSTDPAFLMLEQNKVFGHAAKFDQRPVRHKMLRIDVTESQRTACIKELAAALGPNAVRLKQ